MNFKRAENLTKDLLDAGFQRASITVEGEKPDYASTVTVTVPHPMAERLRALFDLASDGIEINFELPAGEMRVHLK